MSDYFHEETVKELELEIILLKAQRDALLGAAKAVISATRWLKDEEHERAYRRLEDAIEKIERAS